MDSMPDFFIRRILKALSSIAGTLSDLKDQITRIVKDHDAREKQNDPSPPEPISIGAITGLPIAVTEYYKSNTQNKWGKWLKLLIELGALAAAFWLGWLNREVLIQIQKQTPKIIESADAAKSAARTAAGQLIETSREFQEGQRAWMGAVSFQITKYPDPFQAIIKFVNSGKTPARNLRNAVSLSIINPPLLFQPPPEYMRNYQFKKGGATAPQGEFNLILEDSPGVAVSQTVAAQNLRLQDKRQFLYVHGELQYDIGDGKPHRTIFCFYMDNPMTHVLVYCEGHNDMN